MREVCIWSQITKQQRKYDVLMPVIIECKENEGVWNKLD